MAAVQTFPRLGAQLRSDIDISSRTDALLWSTRQQRTDRSWNCAHRPEGHYFPSLPEVKRGYLCKDSSYSHRRGKAQINRLCRKRPIHARRQPGGDNSNRVRISQHPEQRPHSRRVMAPYRIAGNKNEQNERWKEYRKDEKSLHADYLCARFSPTALGARSDTLRHHPSSEGRSQPSLTVMPPANLTHSSKWPLETAITTGVPTSSARSIR